MRTQLPTTIGKYSVTNELGRGATSVVYRGRDPDLDRDVAIKILECTNEQNEEAHQRLRREALALARVQHDNIVPVHEVGLHEERLFVVLDCVEGKTLDLWIQERRPTRNEILNVLLAAGAGLAAVHRAGLIHRDFKPQNVMVDERGRVRVLDLGLVTALEGRASPTATPAGAAHEAARIDSDNFDGPRDLSSITKTADIIGTPKYMAPERLEDERAPSPLEDQFSFALTLYESMFADCPFPHAQSTDALRERDKPWCPRPSPAAVHDAVWPIIERALSYEPDQRYPDMDAMLEALRGTQRTIQRSFVWIPIVAIGALMVGLIVFLGLKPRGDCFEHADTSSFWDQYKNRLDDKFLREGVIEDAVSSYLDPWSEVYQGICELRSNKNKSVDYELLKKQSDCLDQGRNELKAILEGYAALPDDNDVTIKNTLEQIDKVPSVERCKNLNLLKELQLSPLEVTASIDEEINHLKVSSLVQLPSASAKAEAIVNIARGYDDPLLLARALMLEGELMRQRRMLAPALERFKEARHSAERGGDDWLVMQILESITNLHIHNQDAKKARASLNDAHSKWARLGKPRVHGALGERYLGLIAYEEGHYKQAIEHHERALEIWQKLGKSKRLQEALELQSLGRAYSDIPHRRKRVSEYNNKALKIYEELLGPDHRYVFSVRYNSIIDLYERGDFDSALEDLRELIPAPKREQCTSTSYQYAMIEGLIAGQRGEAKLAEESGRKLVECLEKLNISFSPLAIGHLLITEAYIDQGRFAEASRELETARELYGSDKLERATLLIIEAKIALSTVGAERSRELLDDAERLLDAGDLSETEPRRAELELRRAAALRALGADGEALKALSRALNIWNASESEAALTDSLPEQLPEKFDTNCDIARLCAETRLMLADLLHELGDESGRACALARRALERSAAIKNEPLRREIEAWIQERMCAA